MIFKKVPLPPGQLIWQLIFVTVTIAMATYFYFRQLIGNLFIVDLLATYFSEQVKNVHI